MNDKAKPLKPEETVRQAVIRELIKLGWRETQLRWKPEWQVPDTPHDLTKRERGQKFDICGSADLVAFADDSEEWFALQIIFEFKAPDIDAGRSQLIRYLSNEPMAKMGFWTNGSQTLAVYKNHHADWHFVENAPYPHPTDDLTNPRPLQNRELITDGVLLRQTRKSGRFSDGLLHRGSQFQSI